MQIASMFVRAPLQTSGGQPAPNPSLAVGGRNGRVADEPSGILNLLCYLVAMTEPNDSLLCHLVFDHTRSHRGPLFFTEAIADMTLGQDINWASRVVFNFLSQLIDDNSQIFALVAVGRTPNRSQQIFVFDGSAGMLHQTTEGLVFFWSEVDLFALFLYEAAIGVERDLAHDADQIWFSHRGVATPDD
jgi:hypothetical protein